jgi:hypothetical protein
MCALESTEPTHVMDEFLMGSPREGWIAGSAEKDTVNPSCYSVNFRPQRSTARVLP